MELTFSDVSSEKRKLDSAAPQINRKTSRYTGYDDCNNEEEEEYENTNNNNNTNVSKPQITQITQINKNPRQMILQQECFEELRKLRSALCSQKSIPPAAIFDDKTLLRFAEHLPVTKEQMASLCVLTDKKFSLFGSHFIPILIKYSMTSNVSNNVTSNNVTSNNVTSSSSSSKYFAAKPPPVNSSSNSSSSNNSRKIGKAPTRTVF